jgi:adenylate cyclase
MPDLPPSARVLEITQGYLKPGETDTEGRLRRTLYPDGRRVFRHTVKSGHGLVRTEVEREISEEEFDRLWPATAGRRLSKLRHVVDHGGFTWEIDRFLDLDLVLAEVELPDPDAEAPVPAWLAPLVVREVTEEPEYRNFELALRAHRRTDHAT